MYNDIRKWETCIPSFYIVFGVILISSGLCLVAITLSDPETIVVAFIGILISLCGLWLALSGLLFMYRRARSNPSLGGLLLLLPCLCFVQVRFHGLSIRSHSWVRLCKYSGC